MEIDIRSNFLDVANAFKNVKVNQVGAAARFAINRTLLTLRKESIQKLTEKLKIKPRTLREKYIALVKARGSNLSNIYGIIAFSTDPIPLLEFVRGNKTPQSQKGIPVKRRKKVRVEIMPGKRFVVPHAFIQRVHTTQVFKRGSPSTLKKQAIRSVGSYILNKGIGKELVAIGQQRFKDIFLDDLDKRINGVFASVPDVKDD